MMAVFYLFMEAPGGARARAPLVLKAVLEEPELLERVPEDGGRVLELLAGEVVGREIAEAARQRLRAPRGGGDSLARGPWRHDVKARSGGDCMRAPLRRR